MAPPLPPATTPSPAGLVPPPTGAFQGVSWFALGLGAITFIYAVWYAPAASVDERYFLYTAFLFSLFGCMSVSKVVRDRQEGIPVSALFFGFSYVAAVTPFVLVGYNLVFESTLVGGSHRGLLGMSYAISAYAVIAISKNERDKQVAKACVPR